MMDNPNSWCPAGTFVLAVAVVIVMLIKWINQGKK